MNNSVFEIDMILHNKKYPLIYRYTSIILLALVIAVYILLTYDYHTYYKNKGIVIYDNEFLIKVYSNIEDIDLIIDNNRLEIEGKIFNYQVSKIDENIYVSENNQNQQIVYLKVEKLKYIENRALEFKIEKKRQKIIYHILDYLERR